MGDHNFREGDVVSYTPAPQFPGQRDTHWCREGLALVGATGLLVDTYWASMSDAHVLTDAEIATAVLRFNVGDFDELDRYRAGGRDQWMRYAPKDRELITSQHRLQARYFVRKGASEDLATQIANAEQELGDAQSKLQSAQWNVERAQRELDELRAKTPPCEADTGAVA